MKKAISGPRRPRNPIDNPDKNDPRKNIPEVDPDRNKSVEDETPIYEEPPFTGDSIDGIVYVL